MWCTVLCAAMLGVGCSNDYAHRSDTLSVALGDDIAGYFVVGGEPYGYVSSVAEGVAGLADKKLTLQTGKSISQLSEGLRNGSIDIAVIPSFHRVELHRYPSAPLYTTDYVLMMPSWAKTDQSLSALEMCRGKRVATDEGFRCHTNSFGKLKEYGAQIDTSVHDGHKLAQRLLRGRYDAIVCEHSEAKLVNFLYRDIRRVASFEEPVDVIMIFANRGLKEWFTGLLATYSLGEDYASTTELYFGSASVASNFVQLRYRPTRVVGGISVWDERLKEIAGKVGVDWRLLSAMARHESGFRNDLVSNMGAVGLMQVTPIVAEEFEVEEEELTNPDINISLAAKLIHKNSRALGFGDWPSDDDGISIVVASYHCGITRTMEAQRLSRKLGGTGKRWEEVKEMLTNMGDSEWNKANGCNMGRFKDHSVTITYVERVMSSYDTYRQTMTN